MLKNASTAYLKTLSLSLVNTKHWYSVGEMLAHSFQLWPSIMPALDQRLVFWWVTTPQLFLRWFTVLLLSWIYRSLWLPLFHWIRLIKIYFLRCHSVLVIQSFKYKSWDLKIWLRLRFWTNFSLQWQWYTRGQSPVLSYQALWSSRNLAQNMCLVPLPLMMSLFYFVEIGWIVFEF